MAQKSRGWCFTLNNYTQDECDRIAAIDCVYKIVGKEICPKTGTPHLQGYVYFKCQRHFGGVKALIGERAHLERANGSAQSNRTYCSKAGDLLVEDGEIPRQGARIDLQRGIDVLCETKSVRAAINSADNISYQLIRTVECYTQYLEDEEREQPVVKWFWGPTGSGKTRTARAEAGRGAWISARDLRWFPKYDAHENVIFDDFRFEYAELSYMLRLLDREALQVEVKGGFRPWLPKNIWITSDRPPNDMWFGTDLKQIMRRISEVRYFGSVGSEVGGNTITPTSTAPGPPGHSSVEVAPPAAAPTQLLRALIGDAQRAASEVTIREAEKDFDDYLSSVEKRLALG